MSNKKADAGLPLHINVRFNGAARLRKKNATHADALAPFGVDAVFLSSGRTILTGVQRGREAQGKASAAMPAGAAELQFVKGKAYLLIKQLSRAAHRVLNAERAKAYTPTRLFRTPKKSSVSSTETPVSNS